MSYASARGWARRVTVRILALALGLAGLTAVADRESSSLHAVASAWLPVVTVVPWPERITEALRVEAEHFVDCVRTGRQPVTGGEAGLRVVRILEAAAESLARRGQVVEVA